jgi:outer membrane protein TolC
MTNKLSLFIFVFYSVVAFTQEKTYSFSLEEAVTFALDSNYTALNAKRDIAKAIKKKWETTATGLPQINGNVSYNNNLKQPVTLVPSEFFGGEPGTFAPVTFGTKQSANAVATLEQLIFDGSYLVGLQAAKAFLDYSENANEKTQLEVRKGVINAYGSVLLAEELVAIFRKNKENLEKNLFETEKIYENGLTEEENVEQLEITLLDIETNLNNVERMQGIAKQMFNASLGIDINAEVILTQNLDELTKENIQLNTLSEDLSIENNIDYKIAYNLTEQRSLEMKLEKSRALPRLSAFVNYGTQANSNNFTFFDSDQIWYQSSILGVSMNIPIFSSGLRSSRTQQARISLDQSKTQLEETIQNVKLQFDSAKSDYQFSIDKYENAKKNLALAERIENKNQIKFTEGIATSFDLRQAQTQLYTAQQQYFQSMLDVINAKTQLETVLNTVQLNN